MSVSDLMHDFPVVMEMPVRWGDMDAFNHVNNVVYLRYFESARIAYFERLGFGISVADQGIGPILAATSCEFKFPLTYPDTISIAARSMDLERDRFRQEYLVVSHTRQRVAARGDGIIVSYDYDAKRKAPIPPPVRAAIEQLESRTPGVA